MTDQPRGEMRKVVFTAAAGPAAGLVIQRVAQAMPDAEIVVLASRPLVVSGGAARLVDLVGVDLDGFMDGADAVVHLGIAVDDRDPYLGDIGRSVAEFQAVHDAANRCEVPELVVVSSSIVLGALASNPVPLTEAAVVHPEPGLRPAVELAEVERIIGEDDGGVTRCTVLRSAPVVADASPGWLAGELHRSLAYPDEDHDPGLQYVHASDLGDAVICVLGSTPGSVVHVAPDGSLSGAQRRALETRPRIRVSDRAARATAALRSTVRGSECPEGIRPYLLHPWLVANDRLRNLGWEPAHTNEEAYVAAFRPAPWSMIGSGRRQELLLGGVGALAAGIAVGAGVLIRRRRR